MTVAIPETRPPVSTHGIGSDPGGHYDGIVLGAGISGLVSASVLQQQGATRVLVVDTYARLGGNHIDGTHGPFTFDVGSFIFQDDSPLLRHFPDLLPLYLPIKPTWGRVTGPGRVRFYPLSVREDFLTAGPVELARILTSLAWARLWPRPHDTAEDYAVYWMGRYFYRKSNLNQYIHRLFGSPASELTLSLAEMRMGWISEHARLAGQVRRLFRKQARATNTQLVRPREGFARLYGPAWARLEARGGTLSLGRRLLSLRRSDTQFTLRTDGLTATAPRVVSTIPLTRTEELCGLEPTPLQSVTMISLYFSFVGRRGFKQPILYNFTADGAWKRLTMHSDFYGREDGREYFSVEVVGDWVENNLERAEADFRQHAVANSLFLGHLRREGAHVLEHAYPIYHRDTEDRIETALRRLAEFGLTSLGRQGAFRYQPTARASTVDAEARLERARNEERAP